MKETPLAILKAAQRWCSKEYAKRRPDDYAHPSHLASKILRECKEKFDLGTFGVEGWANDTMNGVSYLNTGDTYALTVCVHTTRTSARFVVSSWGDIAERQQSTET